MRSKQHDNAKKELKKKTTSGKYKLQKNLQKIKTQTHKYFKKKKNIKIKIKRDKHQDITMTIEIVTFKSTKKTLNKKIMVKTKLLFEYTIEDKNKRIYKQQAI